LSRNSTRPPRSALSQSGGSEGLGRPLARRNETSCKASLFFTGAALAVKQPSSPSTSQTCRRGIRRPVIEPTAKATAAIHSPKNSLSSEIIASTPKLSSTIGCRFHRVPPRQHAIRILLTPQVDHHLRRGLAAIFESDGGADTKEVALLDRGTNDWLLIRNMTPVRNRGFGFFPGDCTGP
jgi:hypothetical protein